MDESWRGHKVYLANRKVLYCDTHTPVVETRPCGYCLQENTPEGHDGCIGELMGVMNACCGHGEIKSAYVQYTDGYTVRGAMAYWLMYPESWL